MSSSTAPDRVADLAAGDEPGHVGHHDQHGHQHGYSADKARIRARLSRIEGQVRGIGRMVDDDTYCIDVLTQVSAATRALENVALLLLEDHLDHCVRDAADFFSHRRERGLTGRMVGIIGPRD